MIFRKRSKAVSLIDSKFHVGDYVDFFYKDDVYFGRISNVYLDRDKQVIYDIDIAGQCPATLEEISEEKVIRFHK